jgi:small basic protein
VIALVALVAGIVVGLILRPSLPVGLAPYLPVVVVAALDVVLEGVEERLEGAYHEGELLVGFLANSLLAVFVVWLGDRLGAPDLTIGVIIVFGFRMFQHLTAIRRFFFRG